MAGNNFVLTVDNLWKVFGLPRKEEERLSDADALKECAAREGVIAAVRDISFQIKRGEVFVVMGLSGSGKSTLVRCLLRLIEPTAGRIVVGSELVNEMNERQLTEFRRSKVAMVFQNYGLLPHRNVLDNVGFGLKLCGVPRSDREERARKAIEKVGLAGWEDRFPGELSGGMQQRVGIARALVREPELLLMDEPFSSLDPLIRREMQEQLLQLQKEYRKTILFITHDLSEALRLGDRMAIMREGSFVQVGRPKDIVMNPADHYVQQFVQDEQRMAKLIDTASPPLSHAKSSPEFSTVN